MINIGDRVQHTGYVAGWAHMQGKAGRAGWTGRVVVKSAKGLTIMWVRDSNKEHLFRTCTQSYLHGNCDKYLKVISKEKNMAKPVEEAFEGGYLLLNTSGVTVGNYISNNHRPSCIQPDLATAQKEAKRIANLVGEEVAVFKAVSIAVPPPKPQAVIVKLS